MNLILIEHDGQQLRKASLELFSAARNLNNGPVMAVVLGANSANLAGVAEEAAKYADQVLIAAHAALEPFTAQVAAQAIAQLANDAEATTVFIAGNRAGREIAPRVAMRLDAAYLEDCIKLEKTTDGLRGTHYAYLARVTETIESFGRTVVSIKPNSQPAAEALGTPGEIFEAELNLSPSPVRVTGRSQEKTARVALTEANLVVTGGRGMGSQEDFALVEALADMIGAGVGATRAVVDAGWRPYSEQVGQTGKTVQPNAYIALGVSGAVQHLSGMGKSKFIVAVNKDAEAPIFKVADYGVVGDVHTIVPAMIEAAKKLKD